MSEDRDNFIPSKERQTAEDPFNIPDSYRPTDEQFYSEVSQNPAIAKYVEQAKKDFKSTIPHEIFIDPKNRNWISSLLRKSIEGAIDLAGKDHLTGLDNKGGFLRKVPEHIDRALRAGVPVLYSRGDTDGFKGVNDRLGHEPGDDVLRKIAERYQQIVRSDDLIARIGGDEYDGLFAGSEAIAYIVADRLGNYVPSISPTAPNGEVLNVSLSMGFSVMTEEEAAEWKQLRKDKKSVDHIVRKLAQRADEGVQWAKYDGKNCSRVMLAPGQQLPVLEQAVAKSGWSESKFTFVPAERGKAPERENSR